MGPGLPGEAWGDEVERSRTVEWEATRAELRRVHQEDFCGRLELASQSRCGVAAVPHGDVEVRVDGEGRGSVWGVSRCGSVWACPVCARSETRDRARDLEAAVDACLEAGGAVYMVTATIPHHAGHTCRDVLDAVSSSWSYVLSGGPWSRWADRIGYIGSVRGYDVTHSDRSGWHWHVHALVMVEAPLEAELRDRWRSWMSDRWARKIEAWYVDGDGALDCRPLNREIPDDHDPHFGRPHPEHGLQVQRGESAAEYLASIGLSREISSMETKRARSGHRTPWQILHDYATFSGEDRSRDGWLWMQYVRASKGRAQLYWSPGLRDRLGVAQQLELELGGESDDAEEEAGPVVLRIASHVWRHAAQLCIDLRARVIAAAEAGGYEAACAVIEGILRPSGWRLRRERSRRRIDGNRWGLEVA